jgi:hypothetical protein
MSSPFTRVLRKLYPRHVRDRYGGELLDLQDELRARGEISRAGLLRDAIAGAVLARSSRQRASLTLSVVTALAGLVLAGVLIIGHTGLAPNLTPASTRKGPLAIATITPQLTPRAYHSCFVTNGSPCSLDACTEYIEDPATGDIVGGGTGLADERATQARCAASPTRSPQARPVSK